MVELITQWNGVLNGLVWGPMLGLPLLFIAGLVMTICTKGFQFTKIALWMEKTLGAVFTNKHVTAHTDKNDKAISQFQSMCTALSATLGTGNIVGVATAVAVGGPGAVFWMWIMAILGMMTNFSENVLGIYYRRKNAGGEWSGGAMYYLKDGLGKVKGCAGIGTFLAGLFAVFCALAAFGIGNMSQVQSIASNMENAFSVPPLACGIVLMVLAGLVILGGIKRIASVTEKIVPFMALIYIVGALIIIVMNISHVPAAFAAIFQGAFGLSSVAGGAIGVAITQGFKRGAFSNEAGLGSSVMVHSSSNVKEPVQQGMWGIFEVFMDTIVVCTLTALVVLTGGMYDLTTGEVVGETGSIVANSFGAVFGTFGTQFIAIAILLFAFSTVLGWSHYGAKAFEYLFGSKSTMAYKAVFVLFVLVGSALPLSLAIDISDTLNGLMMIPNLIGVLALSGTVAKITKNYLDRKVNGQDVDALYSAFEEYNVAEDVSVEA
ncbi:MAG: alanine/glycine:cation symporter family protein [Faecalibacterium sp.]